MQLGAGWKKIMELNKTTTHAVRLLAACARNELEIVKVAQLAEELDLSQQNTFKIVHLLSRAGFVNALRGRNGGVRLSRPAGEIGVGEVVLAMEYPALDGRGEARASPSRGSADVPLVEEAFRAFIEVLNQNSIADVAQGGPVRPAATRQMKKSKPAKQNKAKEALRPSVRTRSPAKRSSTHGLN